MSIPVTCAACGASVRVEDRLAGRSFACTTCGARVPVPAAGARTPQPESRRSPEAPKELPPALDIRCPGCGNVTSGNATMVGKRVRCKRCEQIFRVTEEMPRPAPRPSSPPAPAPKKPQRAPPAAPVDWPAPKPDTRPYDVLAGLDDAELAATKLPSVPLAPLSQPSRTARRSNKGLVSSELEGDTLATVGKIYAILVVVGLMVVGALYGVFPAIALAMFLGLGIPNLACYIIVLTRMARNGDLPLAILCFFLCGLGPLIAFVASFSNAEKWRLGGLFRVWATLYLSSIGMCVLSFAAALLLPAFSMGWQAAQTAREGQVAREGPAAAPAPAKAPGFQPPTAVQPPAMGVTDSDEVLQTHRDLKANAEKMLALLRGVTDKESAERAGQERRALLAAEADLRRRLPRHATFTGDRGKQSSELHHAQSQLAGQVMAEEMRIRAIPAAAEPLGMVPGVAPSRPPRAAAPTQAMPRAKDRPPASTPEEKISQALEDLATGDIFHRRDAVKSLRQIPLDAARQADVAKALESLLVERDPWLKEDATAALETWGTAASVPALARFLDDAGFGDSAAKRNAIRTLARLQDSRGIAAIVKMLFTREADAAVQALKDMGPAAETAVLPLLDHQDPALRREMCNVLEVVGTTRSISDLRRRATDRGPGVKEAARRAINAINERNRTGASGNDVTPAASPGRRTPADILKPVPK